MGVWVDKPFAAYRGDLPYIFVCYAHEDSDAVYPEIAWLHDQGARIWYDEGISPGLEWTEALASAIQGSSKVLFFVTPHSVTSEHCRRELNFAQEEDHDVVAVHLGDTEVPPGLRLSLNNRQAILRRELSDDLYHQELMEAAQAAVVAKPAPQPTAVKPSRNRIGVAMAAAAAVAVLAGSVWWLSTGSKDASVPAIAAADSIETQKQDPLHNSIAVLPFENLSPDPDNAFFAAGIHEEVINQLVKIRDLSVIARTSVMQYAGVHKPITEIASELNVSTVMEGSVRYAGNRVRITAQLIDARSGAHMWSEAYEEDLEDIFGIQLAIATRIADTLEAQLSPTQAAMANAVPTTNANSYLHYLRANSLVSAVNPIGPVFAELDLAIEADPEFARAYATKAFFQALAGFPFPDTTPSRESIKTSRVSARQNARRALALDPNQSRAWLTLGQIAIEQSRFDEGTTLVEKGYALGPNDIFALAVLQNVRVMQDRWDEVVSLSDKTIRLDPLNPSHLASRSINAWWLEHYDTAAEAAQKMIALQPDGAQGYNLVAQAAAGLGDAQTAIENVGLALERNRIAALSPWVFADAASVFYQLGLEKEADEMIERITELAVQQYVAPPIFLWAYLGSTNNEMIIRWLRAAIEQEACSHPCRNTIHLSKHSAFDSVRDDPEFQALITGM